MADHNFHEQLHSVVNGLPKSWNPRREQPEWDRMFNGRASIQHNFTKRTDKAQQWLTEAAAFSEVIKGGFESPTELSVFAGNAREFIAKGTAQGLDS